MMILRGGGGHDFSAACFGGEGLRKLFQKVDKVKEGVHQKVSACTSLDKSVHNGSLYCCVCIFDNLI